MLDFYRPIENFLAYVGFCRILSEFVSVNPWREMVKTPSLNCQKRLWWKIEAANRKSAYAVGVTTSSLAKGGEAGRAPAWVPQGTF